VDTATVEDIPRAGVKAEVEVAVAFFALLIFFFAAGNWGRGIEETKVEAILPRSRKIPLPMIGSEAIEGCFQTTGLIAKLARS